jgi:hypothetical protein
MLTFKVRVGALAQGDCQQLRHTWTLRLSGYIPRQGYRDGEQGFDAGPHLWSCPYRDLDSDQVESFQRDRADSLKARPKGPLIGRVSISRSRA